MKFFNDQFVPDDLPLEELEKMLRSVHIQDFALGCEELALTRSREAFDLMRRYYAEADSFRQRGLLSILLDYPFAGELTDEVLEALDAADPELVEAALVAIAAGKIKVPDGAILTALEENQEDLSRRAFAALDMVARTPENEARINALN